MVNRSFAEEMESAVLECQSETGGRELPGEIGSIDEWAYDSGAGDFKTEMIGAGFTLERDGSAFTFAMSFIILMNENIF